MHSIKTELFLQPTEVAVELGNYTHTIGGHFQQHYF